MIIYAMAPGADERVKDVKINEETLSVSLVGTSPFFDYRLNFV